MPGSPTGSSDATLTEVLDGLQREGYDGTFLVGDDGSVRCRTCDTVVAPEAVHLDGLRRIEGASDPADMAAILAVRCDSCGSRGSIVARYGPEAGPGDSALLLAVESSHGPGLDVAEAASLDEPEHPNADPDPRGSPARGSGSVTEPDEAVGDFGGEEQSDAGGDSDVGSH